MTADYTRVASYDIRAYLWAQLQAKSIINPNNYHADGFDIPLVPIIPAQQVPEFNNLLPGKTYILYDIAQRRSQGTQFWMQEESMTLEITSRSASEIQTISNFIIDLFRRYDKSAVDLNVSILSNSPFNFLWFRLESADPVQSFQNEGGFMTGLVTINYAYTRTTDGVTGLYL